VSPRSLEFIEAARRRLALARSGIEHDPAGAVSAAYYAMLYAARGALSERDCHARTHQGTWHMFREQFVAPGLFNAGLAVAAQAAQPQREQADYEAWLPNQKEAREAVELAQRFIAAVQQLLAGGDGPTGKGAGGD
jgi:uncharacterized protein (UPF0332 family)